MEYQLRCYYCGVPATEKEHVVPRSLLEKLNVLQDGEVMRDLCYPGRVLLVPSCSECNRILGKKYFKTLGERRHFVKAQLRHKYQRLLGMPSWSEDELSELKSKLRGYVEMSLQYRALVLERLKWLESLQDCGL